MTCREYHHFLKQYQDGTLQPADLDVLLAHQEKCPDCRQAFDRAALLEKLLSDALRPNRDAQSVRKAVLSRLPEKVSADYERIMPSISPWRKLAPLAACLLLTAGLAAGFVAGLKYQSASLEGNVTSALPLRIALLEGKVLVRHTGMAYWQEVTPQTTLRLGDHLQTTAPAKITFDFEDKSFLTLDSSSSLALTRWNGGMELDLNYGSVRASLQSPHPPFFVSTPQGRIEALGTEFTVTVN
jgi:ferric-dicitrate binding protein FerR (iron transport regulator)